MKLSTRHTNPLGLSLSKPLPEPVFPIILSLSKEELAALDPSTDSGRTVLSFVANQVRSSNA
jgi:hypothetical protein